MKLLLIMAMFIMFGCASEKVKQNEVLINAKIETSERRP